MIEIISCFFINKQTDADLHTSRSIYGIVCSAFGIVLNLIMFLLKITAGLLSGSVAATVDAVHNLTDSASSVVTLLSFTLSGRISPRRAEKTECIAGFFVGVMLISAGVTLARSSAIKIASPEPVVFSALSLIMLIMSILIKLYMAYFNLRTGIKTESVALKAAATDCFCDSISTIIAAAALVSVKFTDFNLDAWGGLAVSVFILLAGAKSAKEAAFLFIKKSKSE